MPGPGNETEVSGALHPDIDVAAYVAGLGEQDEKSAIPGIIVLEEGKPAQFIPTEPPPASKA